MERVGNREFRQIGVTQGIEFLCPRSYYLGMSTRNDYVTYILVLVGFALFHRFEGDYTLTFNLGWAAIWLIVGVALSFAIAHLNTLGDKSRERFKHQLYRGLLMTALWVYIAGTSVPRGT